MKIIGFTKYNQQQVCEIMRKSKFVNGNRTKEQRKARYCFFRHIGFNRTESRVLDGWRDSKVIELLKQEYPKLRLFLRGIK
jgi:hypothetical protein